MLLRRPAALLDRAGVSVTDALRVADDFLFQKTTARSAGDFFALFDFASAHDWVSLEQLKPPKACLILDGSAVGEDALGMIAIFDDRWRRRLHLRINAAMGYESRGGVEYPAGGLEIVRVWNDGDSSEKPPTQSAIPALRDF